MNTEIEIDTKAVPLLGQLAHHIRDHSREAYLVGGFLRDTLLGRSTRDIDLAVTGPFEALAKTIADSLGGSLVILGKEERAARVVLPPGDETGDTWQVDITPFSGDIASDLARRDFTIDALAVSLHEAATESRLSNIIDLFDGLEDLRNKTVRAVGPEVFRSDPVRMMRAVRLSAELGFSIASDTQTLIRRDVKLLREVAPERIRTELCVTLATDRAYQSLRLMETLGLLQALIPELDEGKGVGQPKEHFWEVYDHSLETVRAVEQILGETTEEPDEFIASLSWVDEYLEHLNKELRGSCSRRSLVKLAGLLHDVAKPRTKSIQPNGRMRFFGHSEVGAEMVGSIMRRLRFGARETNHVETVVLHHLRPGLMNSPGELPTLRAIYKYFRDTEQAAVDTVLVNLADYRAARGPLLTWDEWKCCTDICRHILSKGLEQKAPPPEPLVTGHDLMRVLQISEGPLVGKLLEEVKEALAAGEINTREQALELAGKSVGAYQTESTD